MPPWKNSNSDLLHYRLTLIPQGQPLWDLKDIFRNFVVLQYHATFMYSVFFSFGVRV